MNVPTDPTVTGTPAPVALPPEPVLTASQQIAADVGALGAAGDTYAQARANALATRAAADAAQTAADAAHAALQTEIARVVADAQAFDDAPQVAPTK